MKMRLLKGGRNEPGFSLFLGVIWFKQSIMYNIARLNSIVMQYNTGSCQQLDIFTKNLS